MDVRRQMRAERWLESVCEGVAPGDGVRLAQRIVARQESKGRELGRIVELMLEPPEVQMPQWYRDAMWREGSAMRSIDAA